MLNALSRLVLSSSAVVLACAPAATLEPVPPPAPAPSAVRDGYDVLRAMRDKYGGRWYTSVEIALQNTLYGTDGRTTQSQWREFLAVPGRQRIDYLPLEQRSGVLYVGGRIYSFINGRRGAEQAGWNALGVLIADVYVQPMDSTIRQLDSLGFDLAKIRGDFWDGDPVWVVGAGPGDTTSSQFWVDRDSLVVDRVIQRETRAGRTQVSDVQFRDFADAGGFPLARRMLVYRDGRLLLQQTYTGVKVNVALPPELFDPAKFSSPPSVP
jgi:hypothetical protein